ncbi:unnamed protein product [Moneuplotes crassus]|uniref:Uncharacterized protein n=1 Tax=Euplotes crassus TaxID=5936 RepID=A0AAD2D9Q1_EUPCR|nr:unnamed protein product [Moneuplotes crassus]
MNYVKETHDEDCRCCNILRELDYEPEKNSPIDKYQSLRRSEEKLSNWSRKPYNGLQYSPEHKYHAQKYSFEDKENNSSNSNVIQPYSPPTFASENVAGRYEKGRISPRMHPEAVPTELMPHQCSISPGYENSSPSLGEKVPSIGSVEIKASKEPNLNQYPSVGEVQNVSEEKSEIKSLRMFNHSIDIGDSPDSKDQNKELLNASSSISTTGLDPANLEIMKGDPFLVNIESTKNCGMKNKKKKLKKKETKESFSTQSEDSVIKADQVSLMQPILLELKKNLIEEEKRVKREKSKRKSKSKAKRAKSKQNPYNYVRSKVAKSINGNGSTRSRTKKKSKRRCRRRAKSLQWLRIGKARPSRPKSVIVKKKCKKRKARSKLRHRRRGPKTEAISETAYSYKPLNIKTEVAVKLFPKKKSRKREKTVSAWTRGTKKTKKTNVQSQVSWINRNACPKKQAYSEYEKYEDIFIKGKSKRTDVVDHAWNNSKRERNEKWAQKQRKIFKERKRHTKSKKNIVYREKERKLDEVTEEKSQTRSVAGSFCASQKAPPLRKLKTMKRKKIDNSDLITQQPNEEKKKNLEDIEHQKPKKRMSRQEQKERDSALSKPKWQKVPLEKKIKEKLATHEICNEYADNLSSTGQLSHKLAPESEPEIKMTQFIPTKIFLKKEVKKKAMQAVNHTVTTKSSKGEVLSKIKVCSVTSDSGSV